MAGVYERFAVLSEQQRAVLIAGVRDRVQLSHAQQRVWFLQQMVPTSPAFNLPEAFRLRGELDVAALRRALAEVGSRHEVLRMRFPQVSGAPVQLLSGAPVSLEVLDASPDDVAALVNADTDHVFDLAAASPIRVRLYRLGADDHLLTVVIHHIVADGVSLGCFYRELASLYAGDTLPPLATSYADHVVVQRETAWDLGFWRDALAGAPAVLDLPTDRPRPPRQSYASDLRSLDVSLDGVRALAERERATPFMVLFAAWAVLLYRFSGQEDLLIGTPVAGRDQSTQDLIGLFANTVVLRASLTGAQTFAEVVRHVRRHALEAYAHADLPHDLVIDSLKPSRDPSRNPLFQAFFSYEPEAASLSSLGAAQASRIEIDTRISARFDVSLAVVESLGGAVAKLGYATDLFDVRTIDTMLACYSRVLLADPDVPISSISLLSDAERAATVRRWTADQALDHVARPTLHALFERQARRTPDAVAVAWRNQRLTYAELDSLSTRFAWHLRAAGVGVGSVVSVCLPRDPWLVVTLLAVLKAGGAYLAVDLTLPKDRIDYLLSDSGTSVVVASSGAWPVPVVDPSTADLSVSGPISLASGEDLAYVVYTSGSTGQPKGVAVEHRGVVNLVEARARVYGAEQFRVALASSSVAFDSAVSELYVSLTTGGAVVLVDNLFSLLEQPPALPVTMLETVPSLLRELLRHGSVPTSVRTICLGGERLPADLVEAVYATGHVERLYNTYGPTETTVSATRALVPRGSARPPIGKPIPGVRTYVLDGSGAPVPVGMRGELCISGVGVARGYLGRPDDPAFVADPFVPGARMYRTGDVVRELPDGDLEWLGRSDRQVKIHGQRIEFGEIEHALCSLPSVSAAVVTVHEGSLCAYVVSDSLDPLQLRSSLRSAVPAHLVPTYFVRLDSLPLTVSGKLDTAALPTPSLFVAPERSPSSPTEIALAEIWCSLLDRPSVGALDDFFLLGGHSLLGLRLVHQVEAVLGVRLEMTAVFESPTLEGLAEVVDTLLWMRSGSDVSDGVL